MKNKILPIVLVMLGYAVSAVADSTNAVPDDTEVKYSQAIEARTAEILKILNLADTNALNHVHDAIIAQYRDLRSWHDDNDAKLKAAKSDTNATAQITATLKTLHAAFLAKLGENLTPPQIEKVKDKMTYGVVQVTYNAYIKMYPELTETEKQQILSWLVEAREIAMDQGSSDEKHAVFGKYKGRINNYLSKAGYDAKTGRKKSATPESISTNAVPAAIPGK